MPTNTCYRCSETKEVHLFLQDKRQKTGYRNICVTCNNSYYRNSYRQNVDRNRARGRERNKAFRLRHPDKTKLNDERSNLRKYRLTRESFAALSAEQGGKCAICGQLPYWNWKGRRTNRLHVDHDHKTDEVRGLLCYNCNLLLGHAKDDIDILEKTIAYLRRVACQHPAL